ncbi:hypothetical protein V5799_012924 [Amblyomma americanum]|uniref:COX assembly mitochondrial protein n=1 Tax=Amblyomma americanum TaxID=6943 RepID=A0AAQ4E7A0_AMBAM
MHTDLSPHLHSEECNSIIALLKKCHEEVTFRFCLNVRVDMFIHFQNKWAKFAGACNDIDVAMRKCLKRERLEKRAKNYEKSRWKRTREA